jgi:predicted NBD/HSP70 family sugar kinase
VRRQLTTVRELRKTNRSLALWELYLRGALSRQQIATGAGFSLATVSNVLGELIDEGLVIEVGLEDSNGGRPRALVQINPKFGHVIGVDIGETAFLVELFDLGMNVRASHRSMTVLTRLDVQDAVGHVADGIALVLRESGVDAGQVLGVGVGAPGLVEHRADGAVVHGQSVGWIAVPVEQLLRERVGLPVVVDNGAMALGQAETWFGAARGVDHAVIALLGIGVGTGIVSHRALYRGATTSAGEWGHTTIVVDGRSCRCGARGCLEAYVGGAAIVSRYDELAGQQRKVRQRDLEKRVDALVAGIENDPVAAQVLDETATYLGVGIANLANLIDPSRVVVGGWLGLAIADVLLPRIRAVAERNALRLPVSHLEIVRAELGPDAVALGAATLPIAEFLNNGGATRRAISVEIRRPDRAPDR